MGDLKLFINRKEELNYLSADLSQFRTASRLLILSAHSGIGKSALVDQVMPEFTGKNRYRIAVPIDKQNNIEDGYVWKLIVKMINADAEVNKSYLTLFQFLKVDKFYNNVAQGLFRALLGYLKLDSFGDGYRESSNKKQDRITEWLSDDKELLDITYRYVLHIAQIRKIFLTIENIQIADNTSLLLLRDLLINVGNIYVIAECTISESDNKVPQLIRLYGNQNIEINHLRIEKINKDELLNSIKDEKELLIGMIENYYENSDGNLHKFQLLRNSLYTKYDISPASFNNITKYIINNLDDISLGLITIVQAHQGQVSLKLLNIYLQYSKSLEFMSAEDVQQKIYDLQKLGFLKLGIDKISIEHDSISADLKNTDKIAKLQIIANRNWIRLYQSLERNTIKYEIDYIDTLLQQLYFMLKMEAFSELPNVLERINRYISITPSSSVVFQLDKIAESCKKFISEEEYSEIFKWLAILYYRCGYSDKVISICSPYLLTDTIVLLCYLASLSTINHAETFQFIDSLDGSVSRELQLGLILVKIRTLRSADNFIECKKLWLSHYQAETFKNTSLEAGFLKYATLVEHDDYNFRIACCEKSLQMFENLNDHFGKISTCVSLSRDYAYIGNLTECKRFLDQAENLTNTAIYPRYTFYNNRAVLDILANNITNLTKDGLNNALRICSNGGNQLIILSNLLVIAIIEKDTVYGYSIFQRIIKIVLAEFDPKDTITHLCLYNCYRFTIQMELKEDSENIFSYIKQFDLRQDIDLWHYLINGEGFNPYPDVIKKEYYPCFMIGWDLDYYTALSNFRPKALKP